jgi:PAS domain S-box-containing protein
LHGLDNTEDLIGRSGLELVADDEKAHVVAFAQDVVEHGMAKNKRYMALRVDDSRVPVDWSAALLKDAQGQPKTLVAISRDMSDSVAAHAALHESERRYRSLAETAHDAIFIVGRDSIIKYVNGFGASLFGQTCDDVVGKNIAELFDEAVTAGMQQSLRRIFADGVDVTTEREFSAHGHSVYLQTRLVPMFDDAGVVDAVLGIARDIGVLKRAQAQAQQSEQHLAEILDYTGDLVTRTDYEGRFLYVNQAAKNIFEVDPSEAIGREAFDFVHPDDRARTQQAFASWIAQELTNVRFENRQVSKSGKVHEVQWTINPHYHADGSLESVLSIGRDVTQSRRLSREHEQFAYAASHDLQEPVRMISSYMQLLQRRFGDTLAPEAQEFVAYAVDGAERMRRLILGLLNFSRAGHMHRPLHRINSRNALDASLQLLANEIHASQAHIDVGPMPWVMADDVQLTQVFQNLISNAIKFRRQSAPQITISAETRGSECVFCIADDGIGIEAKHFERIFIIFQRLHGVSEYEGTGIGLAICKKIIESFGGRIWIESKMQQGSAFYFSLAQASLLAQEV